MLFNQQQFMGASIRSFNASLGWGSSPSNLEVALVADSKRKVLANNFQGESFVPYPVGTPVTFAFSGVDNSVLPPKTVTWYYNGIVRSYRQDNSSTGSPLFSVNLSDPRDFLAGTQLILDDYFGSVSGIPNVLNVFGAVEDIMGLNSAAPGYTGNFGGMQRNSTGTPWWVIRDAIHYLSSGLLSQHYGHYIKYKNRSYTVDLSDLPQLLPSSYRINTTDNMSVLDYVSDVCEAASYDYFVTMYPLYDGLGNPVLDGPLPYGKQLHSIKVNTVDRSYLPQPSAIINFIANTSGAVVKNMGVELRNAANSKFLLGGNIQTIYMAYGSGYKDENDIQIKYSDAGLHYCDDPIHQFFGVNINQNMFSEIRPDHPLINTNDSYIGRNKRAESIIVIDTRDVDNTIYNGAFYLTTADELRAVQVSRENWENYLANVSNYKYIPIPTGDISWVSTKETLFLDCIEKYAGVRPQILWSYNPTTNTMTSGEYIYGTKIPVGYGWPAVPKIEQSNVDTYVKKADGSLLGSFNTQYSNKFPGPNSASPTILFTNNTNILETPYLIKEIVDKNHIANIDGYLENFASYGVHYRNYQTNFFYPVDKEGYTPCIMGYNGLLSGDPTLDNTLTQKWAVDYKIVEYTHTNVYNVHYRKYGRLGLQGGVPDAHMIQALSDFSVGDFNKTNSQLQYNQTNPIRDELHDSRVNAFYNFLRQYAENYGKKYAVGLPSMLVTRDNTGSGLITSYSPADSAYLTTREIAYALSREYLPVNYFGLTQEDNTFLPYVIYPNASYFNFENINTDDITYSYNPDGTRRNAYIKCNVSDEFVYIDRYTTSASYPRAVITLPGTVSYKEEFDLAYRGGTKFAHMDKLAGFTFAKNVVGVDSTFEYDGPVCVPPMFAAITLKDNLRSYGPWWNIGATGTIEYERDESLVPWNYGGFSGLDVVARARISQIALQQEDEQGSVEFPGMPTMDLGSQLEWISNSATYFGPYITDINVDVSEQGLKTTYKMQTWTPKFGKLAKQFEEDISRTGKEAAKAQRIARERNLTGFGSKVGSDLISTKKRSHKTTKVDKKTGTVKRRKNSSSHHILAAQNILIDDGIETVVVTQPNYNTQSQAMDDYTDKAITSLDSIFRPYSLDSGYNGNLAHYDSPTYAYANFAAQSFDINKNSYPFSRGHDVNIHSYGDEVSSVGLTNDGVHYPSLQDYRGIGFRNPMVVVGYGRTLEGKPVPNFNQYEYVDGSYQYSSSGNEESDSYADNYLNRADLWKAGPLNIRWDNRGKMWSPGSILVEGYLIEDMPAAEGRFSSVPFTSGRMILCAGSYANTESGYQPKMWDRADASGYYTSGLLANGGSGLVWRSSGTVYGNYAYGVESGGRPDIFVLLINRSTQLSALSGTYIIASPMPNGEYRPIWVDCETSERDSART